MWEVKAARDKIWLATTTSHSKRGEIALLQADKRLMMAKHLIEEKEYEMGIDTLTKSQMYLQTAVSEIRTAQKDGEYVKDLLEKVSLATVAHRKEIEIMIANCPEDARPTIEKLSDSVKRLYQDTTTYVIEAGGTPPKNPFQ
jgi:sigma54-dependent transcription regulator